MAFKIYRSKPILLTLLPKLISRLGQDHEKKSDLISMLRRIEAGYVGEKRSDYFLEKAIFRGPIRIFTNVELEISPSNSIQIDTIVITLSFIYLLEVKNITGELHFIESPPSLLRIQKSGEENIFDCPVYQLEKNKLDFNLWLEMNGFRLRSSGALVLAFSSSKVKSPPKTMPIFYAKHLPHFLRIKELDSPIMSYKQFEEVSRKISGAIRPFNPTPLCKYFQIDSATVKSGVLCGECHGRLIRKSEKIWFCSCCKKAVRNPFAENLKDWFSLIKSEITTKECRQFLELKNKDAAIYALKSLPLEKRGQSTATKYHYPRLNKPLSVRGNKDEIQNSR